MILDKFDAQSDHRRRLEAQVVRANIWQASVGQVGAFVILMSLIVAGTFLIHSGQDGGGFATIASGVVGAVVVYLKGRSAKAAELEVKRGTARPR